MSDNTTSSTPVSIHPNAQFVDIAKVRALVTAAGSEFFSKERMRGKRVSNCAMLLDGAYYFVVSETPSSERLYGVYSYISHDVDLIIDGLYVTSKEAWHAIDCFIGDKLCSHCHDEILDDGEGYDGLCGSCADRIYGR